MLEIDPKFAEVVPNLTLEVFWKFVPVNVTMVPPVFPPVVGEILVMLGDVHEVVLIEGSTVRIFE